MLGLNADILLKQTDAYCGAGCQSGYGTCTTSVTTTTSNGGTSTPSGGTTAPGLVISTDAKCGNGFTCQGSTFGNCCSKNGWCGRVSLSYTYYDAAARKWLTYSRATPTAAPVARVHSDPAKPWLRHPPLPPARPLPALQTLRVSRSALMLNAATALLARARRLEIAAASITGVAVPKLIVGPGVKVLLDVVMAW